MGRKTVTVEATELLEPDVQYISLVKRGANRIPFRIIKSEKGSMINLDLSRIFKREKPPTILAVIVNKAEVSDSVVGVIKEAGFSVDNLVVQEGCTVFKQVEDMSSAVAVKLNDDVAIVINEADFQVPVAKAEESWASEFYESIQCEGFWSTFGPAAGTMANTLSYALYKAESVMDAKKAASEIIGAFSEYTMSMIGAIPASAFKMGEAVAKSFNESSTETAQGTESEQGETTQKADTTQGAESTAGEQVSDQSSVETSGEEASTEQKSEESSAETTEQYGQESAQESSNGAGDQASVLKAFESVTEVIKSMQTQIADMNDLLKSVKSEHLSLQDKVDAVETIAKSTSKVVLGSDTPGDTISKQAGETSQDKFEVIDTAFQPNLRSSVQKNSGRLGHLRRATL